MRSVSGSATFRIRPYDAAGLDACFQMGHRSIGSDEDFTGPFQAFSLPYGELQTATC